LDNYIRIRSGQPIISLHTVL